jgi:iron(III) transport system substrate-binding protein
MRQSKLNIQPLMMALLCWIGLGTAAEAQLVVDGETISDAKTFTAAKAEGRLLHYGTYPIDAMKPIHQAFEAETGLKVEYVRLPSQSMYQRVTSEYAAKRLEADIVDLTELPLIQQLVERGVLNAPHKVPGFDKIPAAIREQDGRWYALVRPVGVVAVNRSRVADNEIPKSWKDILDPKWKGLIGTANIDAGGSVVTLYSFLREKIDPDFWPKLAALTPRIYPSIAPLATDLARGEIAIAIGAIAEPIWLQMKAGAPVKVIFPSEGISSFPAAGGVSTTAKNPNAAALFLDWITSRHGGNIVARGGAYPANVTSDKPHLEGLDYPPQDQVFNLKLEQWVVQRDDLMKQWRETFGVK